MTRTSRSCVLGTRVSSGKRGRFAALAARHDLSASGLLARLVDDALKTEHLAARDADSDATHRTSHAPADRAAGDRLTLRLRPGDRALAAARADARGMKTCSYLTLLVHNHVRRTAVLPPDELDHLKVACARLASLGRQLDRFGMPNNVLDSAASELRDAFSQVRQEIEAVREATARVVRHNLVSWETVADTERDAVREDVRA